MSNKVTRAELEDFKKNKEQVRPYSNDDITVYWRPALCIHSANCLIGLPEVFNSGKKPWITMKNAATKEIIETVNTCPSRALVYKVNAKPVVDRPRKKGVKKAKYARIQVLKNGPLVVTGNFIIRDPERKKVRVTTEAVVLCRCGGTRKPPFCDGTHLAIGFKG